MNMNEMTITNINLSPELQAKLREAVKQNAQSDEGELSDDELVAVTGGTDGYNPGWAYGPCSKCPGTRYVMQLDYKNLIVCPSCGDWVEF